MIELTREQRQAVAQQGENPLRAVDPDTHTTYVLIPEADYARLKTQLDDDAHQRLHDMYPHVMEVFGRDGWDDPAMDIYNDPDGHILSHAQERDLDLRLRAHRENPDAGSSWEEVEARLSQKRCALESPSRGNLD